MQNTLKQNVIENEEPAVVAGKTPVAPKVSYKPVQSVVNVLNGSFFIKQSMVNQIPFVIFLAFIAMVYIANGYYAEHIIKEINSVNNEIKELRSEYITRKSDLMQLSKQSEVAKKAILYGLKESTEPPKKIVYITTIKQ